jgi:CheY-like chemotaxis protein
MVIQPSSAAPEPKSPSIDLRGVTVLVVDDDLDALDTITAVLVHAHAAVVTAGSVEDALRMLRTTRPDVIISDIGMPDCNGYQLMRMVRSRTVAEGGSTPAIALTGHTSVEDHTRALLAGYQVHLGKPITAGDLLGAIHALSWKG